MDSAMITFLSQYGLLAIFIIITLEYACFPISSEVVLPVSGLIAAQLHHKITVVILISVVAGIIGSSVCYFAARCGRTVIPAKWINRFPKMKRRLQHTCSWQRQHGKTSVMSVSYTHLDVYKRQALPLAA